MKIKLSFDEMRDILEAPAPSFPKYVAPLLNLANQYAQGTRPKVVGQMSELIQDFQGRTVEEWRAWYLRRYPEAIQAATKKILDMLRRLQTAMESIDSDAVRRWVEDLVIFKTFVGLRFQEAILKRVAALRKTSYRLSEPHEEAKGIDGFVGDRPVAIKPETYRTKPGLSETIESEIIFYKKTKNVIQIDIEE
ncbi:MAG: MjaI family restriction endonuclease [bacterium]|nr:MjaI family restriction endonuclease [bacterium]